MDYNENDFQSQNFQLVGEDKFSANLRSFPLSRFDLDEHLGFHNLVEEEVLLGIQGQENNWIDFPRGTSALEFSSSAAESCSIARHNNVWSEATSSESVDLLLKSMGEDEIINDKPDIMDMSANDESHGVDNQVDLYAETDDVHELAQDKYQKNLQGSNDSQWELVPDVQAAEGEEYLDPSNRNLSPDGKIDGGLCTIVDNVTSLYDAIEKSKADGGGLCEAVLYEQNVCEVLLKTEGPSSDDSDSCVVDSQSQAINPDSIDDTQNPEGELAENENNGVAITTQLLIESPASSIHAKYETQRTEIEDCERISSNSLSFTCEKPGLVVKVNDVEGMAVDRQEGKLDENKDVVFDKSFLPVGMTDESCLPVTVTDTESRISPSNLSARKATISVTDLREVHTGQVHVSVDKESSLTYIIPSIIDLDPFSDVKEKVQDLLPEIQDTAEDLSVDGTANKEELGKKEPSVIHFDSKDVEISGVKASSLSATVLLEEKEGDFVSVSHPLNLKNTSPEKISEGDSGAQLASPIKSHDSRPSKGTVGLNSASEQKGSSPCLTMPDSYGSEENEINIFGGSILSNSRKNLDKETLSGAITGSATECIPNAVVQPPSLVQSIVFSQPQNDFPSSAGNVVGSGITPKANGITEGPSLKGKGDIPSSVEAVSDVRNAVSVALVQTASGKPSVHMDPTLDKYSSCKSSSNEQSDQYKLPKGYVSDEQNVCAQTEDNNSSQICTGSTAETNSSEAQIGNSSSSMPNRVSPIEHQELKALGNMILASSEKDETIHMVDGSSNGLHGTCVETRSFTLEVSTSEDLAGRGADVEPSFPNLKGNDISQKPNENSQGLPDEVKVLGSSMKTPNLGKSKNASRPSNEKRAVSKGKTKKEPHAPKQYSAMDVKKSSFTHKSVGTLSKAIPSVEMREHSSNECSIKTPSSVPFQTSVIPDLNSSSSLALVHQPFTDLQQVQLRAQIFVYGALISGMPPDETYMVSAFGGTDGGRNLWEGVWHAWIARFQDKKSTFGGYDTSTHSRPAIWAPEQVSMGNDVQSKGPSASAASEGIITPSAVLNSTMPLPSSFWSHSYGNDGHHASSISRGTYLNFSHTPSSLLHLTSVSRQHVSANSPWLSPSPRPGPWFGSSQISAHDGITTRYSTLSVPETVHVTPVRDTLGPQTTSTVEVISPSALMSIPDASITATASDLPMETSKRAAASGNNKYALTAQKARKRKKSVATEERSLPLHSANMLLSSSSQLNVSSPAPALISMPPIISSTHYQIISGDNNLQKAILSEETCSKIEHAKLQAEDAAALAAFTVKHSQDIWSQLASQKNSGLVSQIEEKLASAAVAAAVASSVAKAAAAAANVAVGAALQAKMMADEAVSVAKTGNTVLNSESGILDAGKKEKLAGISPVSILKGMDKIHGSGAIISAASEVAKRRVESASSATKRAENLDAIVKAAELAAEAVTQAGTIITMGDPLPFTLSQLVDAGPDGFWRRHDGFSMKISKSRSMHGEEHLSLGSAKVHSGSAKQSDGRLSEDKQTHKADDDGGLSSLNEYHEQFEQTNQGILPVAGHERDHPVSSIQKGSVVEVMSDDVGRKGAWFSAQVLDMDDNKAYVCYNDVSTIEGQLKEWIVLEEGEKAPRIRTAHSTTLVKYEGTRKRRREHLGSYIWEIGDHVDAWIHDRWWEGTITEKTLGDETKLTVHFPARNDKQVVHNWNLRPSRIWKDGKWMEWSHSKEISIKPHEGDTPKEKRQRLGTLDEKNHSGVDAVAEMGKISKNIPNEESKKPDDSRLLGLSAKDRTFSIGKSSGEEVISNAFKSKRTGLQKEGSRVVFGVPRPGKKRKFMEVSKHYVANKSEKISEVNDPIKFAKYLMPQASRQPRNTSKVDNKGKKTVEIKPRGAFKAENSRRFQTRNLSEKDKAASHSTSNEDTINAHHKDAISNMNAFKFSYFPKQAEKIDISAVASEDSVKPAPVPISKKKKPINSEMDLAVKSKSSLDSTSTVEDKEGSGNPGKSMHEVMEPRRSNRKIQPTSRLLEGLQSSLVIPKMPSISHERKPSRGGSSSRGNIHA